MGRFFAYALIVLGICCFAIAAHDEHRGIAAASSPGRSVQKYSVSREEDEEKFRKLMAYEWGERAL